RRCSLLTADNASLPINCQIPLRGACAWRDPLTTSDHDVVAALGEDIARRIGEPRYKLWFAHKTKFSWQDDQLVVGVANHFVQEWLEKKFVDDVANSVRSVLGRPFKVRFAIDPHLFQEARRHQARTGAISETESTPSTPDRAPPDEPAP